MKKFLDRYFVKKRDGSYCFKYSKRYMKKVYEREDWTELENIMKYLDYPFSIKLIKWKRELRAMKGQEDFSIFAYIRYCNLGSLKMFGFKDSKRFERLTIRKMKRTIN